MLFIASIILATAVSVIASPPPPKGDKPKPKSGLSKLIVFGDSFSDNGNTFAFTNNTWPADPAYFKGRFSNGPVWAEYLSKSLGIPLVDHAFGGATVDNAIVPGLTGPKGDILVPSVVDQVEAFLHGEAAKMTNVEKRTSVVVLVAGANDAAKAGEVNVRDLTDSLVFALQDLAENGFRTFIVPSTQTTALAPFFKANTNLPPGIIQVQETFSRQWRSNIGMSLHFATLPRGTKVKLWNLLGDLKALQAEMRKVGEDADTSCLLGAAGEVPTRSLCTDPERHLFWDAFHPTTTTHKKIAENVKNFLKAL